MTSNRGCVELCFIELLGCRVRLSKRRQKIGQPPNNTRLVVKHRPLNAQEFRMQRYRERQLEPPGEEEEEDEEEEEEQTQEDAGDQDDTVNNDQNDANKSGWSGIKILILWGIVVCSLVHLYPSTNYAASYSVDTGEFLPRECKWGMKMTTCLHLLARLRMHGVVPPFHVFNMWCFVMHR